MPMALQTIALTLRSAMRLKRLTLMGALCFAALYAISTLSLPFGWDHGIMAAVGDSIVSGGLPYKDSWDLKGPLAFVPFALAEFLFGKVMWGIRVIDLAIHIPALYVVFRAVEAHATTYLAAWTSVLLYLWLASAGWFFSAQPDLWVTAASAIAICPLLIPGTVHDARKFALAGVMIGCAGLIKPFYLLLGLVPLTLIAGLPAISLSHRARLAAALALCAAAPVLLVIAYFVAGGGLSKAIEVHLLYSLQGYSGSHASLKAFFLGTHEFFSRGTVVIIPFVALGLWAHRREKLLFAPLAVWLGIVLLFVAIQRKFYIYHWYPLYPVIAILAAFGINSLLKASQNSAPTRIVAAGAVLVFFVQVAAQPAKEIVRFFWYPHDAYYRSFRHLNYVALDQINAANYIRARTNPYDPVFVFGVDATVRFLAKLPDPTRFTFNLPLSIKSGFRAQYRAEAMHALNINPPVYIVFGFPWQFHKLPKEKPLSEFPALEAFMRQGYTLEKSFGYVDLYRRKPGAGGQPSARNEEYHRLNHPTGAP